jgi:hypothetical protein
VARTKQPDPVLSGCLDTIRGLGGSIHARFTDAKGTAVDGYLDLGLPLAPARERFAVEVTRTHLSYPLAFAFIQRARRQKENLVLFAPYVPSKIGKELADGGLSYVDAVGNCHITVGRDRRLIAHVEGRKRERGTNIQSAGRVPSYKLTFALLAQPNLVNAPVRDLALAAGIGKTAAADNLKRLAAQGFVARSRAGANLVRVRELLDRWLAGYADVLRPNTIIGTYRTQTREPEALEQIVQRAWSDRPWALGAGAAAWRMTHHYRGPETVIHVESAPIEALRELRAIPAQEGSLTLLRAPGTLAFKGIAPHLAHPLLVYAEMVISADPRMREAAQEVRDEFLSEKA